MSKDQLNHVSEPVSGERRVEFFAFNLNTRWNIVSDRTTSHFETIPEGTNKVSLVLVNPADKIFLLCRQ